MNAVDENYDEYLQKYKEPAGNLSHRVAGATDAHRMTHLINRT